MSDFKIDFLKFKKEELISAIDDILKENYATSI